MKNAKYWCAKWKLLENLSPFEKWLEIVNQVISLWMATTIKMLCSVFWYIQKIPSCLGIAEGMVSNPPKWSVTSRLTKSVLVYSIRSTVQSHKTGLLVHSIDEGRISLRIMKPQKTLHSLPSQVCGAFQCSLTIFWKKWSVLSEECRIFLFICKADTRWSVNSSSCTNSLPYGHKPAHCSTSILTDLTL